MSVFQVNVVKQGEGERLVSVEGEITAETSRELSEALIGVLDDSPRKVVIDLAGAGYIASPGIGALVSFLRKLKQVGGDLVLSGVRPEVLELFRVTHLDRVFTSEAFDETTAGN